MSMEKNLKEIIEELIQEVEHELEEATTTAGVDGYQTPFAFSRKSDKQRTKKNATQLGYKLVDNDVDNISEANQINEWKLQLDLGKVNPSEFEKWADSSLQKKHKIKISGSGKNWTITGKGNDDTMGSSANWIAQLLGKSWKGGNMRVVHKESVNEAKIKRPVNRWLELKNDETMHPHKKMAMGLKELKYQLAETEKFFNWYNKIKNINELDSTGYWKRTQSHIYKIKERIINIAKTLQEIEK